jgi:hypothetical protein
MLITDATFETKPVGRNARRFLKLGAKALAGDGPTARR